jgi:hypothetical protein
MAQIHKAGFGAHASLLAARVVIVHPNTHGVDNSVTLYGMSVRGGSADSARDASATTLGFDNFTSLPAAAVPNGYGGLNWGTGLGFINANVLRTPVHSAEIPDVVREATVAIEDRRFYQHQGVDFEGIVRAAVKNLESKKDVQGGSTLTMQLVRNLYTGEKARTGVKGYKRKIREAKLAEELEDRHPGSPGKLWIVNKYVNSVPYGTVGGQTAVGIQAAARVFFDKPASRLKLREAALLAGLPQAPSDYNPFFNPARAKARRNDVLKRMAVADGVLPPRQQQTSHSIPRTSAEYGGAPAARVSGTPRRAKNRCSLRKERKLSMPTSRATAREPFPQRREMIRWAIAIRTDCREI